MGEWKNGKVLLGVRYMDYGHGEGDIVWWIDKGKVEKVVSKGTMDDFHTKLMEDVDSNWRGRFDVGTKVLTIEPPLGPYFRGEKNPNVVMNKLFLEFNPKAILIDTNRGMVKVAKGS